ncbi:integrase catalytic domain-containing protein [Trichonephila clavipes]|nr:integrase catalytic domain-containing protein [Trichonephila clavipes]
MFVNDMCISDLWKFDSLGITDPVKTKTKLEIQKETLNHFQKTISVDISGRYEVALPWVLDNKLSSSNRKLAENRLESTKRKLIATGKFEEYQDVLDIWLSGKIIEEVNDDKENFVHYLPHRPVIKENSTKLESQPDNFETMVLGLIWNLKDDCLSCNINCQKNEGKAITKRSLLSMANHIFDPIGFTAPVTLKPKLILQEIWKLKLKWDENLPKDILNQVKKWLEQLPILAACVLGTRLAASVKNDLNLPDVRIYYLTDSMTALAWIQRTRDWGVFVSNRVKEIRNLSDVSSWEHVPSEKNFADILSRGCSAQQLVYLRWWESPSWLSESPVQCPRSKQVPDEEAVNLELRKSVLVNTAKRIEEFHWHYKYFSSYLKVVRMIAGIFRFFKNAKRIDVCNTSEITFSEFDHAEKTVIKLIQMEKFEGVTDEKLRPLKPFLDEFGILRARTKLSFREDTHNFKFPIILPNEHPVVHLMIVRKHEELMHAGVSIVMNHLR